MAIQQRVDIARSPPLEYIQNEKDHLPIYFKRDPPCFSYWFNDLYSHSPHGQDSEADRTHRQPWG